MESEAFGISLAIVAAIISIYNAILFYRQSKLVEKQTLLQRSQVYPYVRIREANVEKGTFKLALENMAEAPAFELGLLVSFVPCSLGEKHWRFIDEITWTGDDEMKTAYPRRAVIPFKNQKGLSRLYGKEKDTYNAKLLFLFSSSKKGLWEGKGKADDFAELRRRLTDQGIRFVALMIALVYKDVAETVEEFEPIKDFVVDFQKHDTLEKAWKEGIPFSDKSIGYEEIPFIDYDFYRFKSYRGRLEPFR